MITVDHGKIYIDNVDISDLRNSTVRHLINVVPQDPVWIPGTIRTNVDPLHVAPDDTIERALRRVGLWSVVEAQGGLDKKRDTTAFSSGQKQLLCFARAMVKQSKILVLDEAMSRYGLQTPLVESRKLADSE
jgi:ABC-type multidrug transport system fused ATPase/permease subunit